MRINNMKKGRKYIRIAPANYENGTKDYSYTDEPIVFDGITDNGELLIQYPKESFEFKTFGMKNLKLPKVFNDGQWIPFEDIENQEKTSLNAYAGKKIKRVKPVKLTGKGEDRSCMDGYVQLIVATKYHVVAFWRSKKIILDCRFANPRDWAVVK